MGTTDIASLPESSSQNRSDVARVLNGSISQFYWHTQMFNPQSEWTTPAFAFLSIAGTHLPTQEGWKAELTWVAGYIVRQFTCPKAVTIPLLTGLNVAQLRWSRPTRYRYTKPPQGRVCWWTFRSSASEPQNCFLTVTSWVRTVPSSVCRAAWRSALALLSDVRRLFASWRARRMPSSEKCWMLAICCCRSSISSSAAFNYRRPQCRTR